MKKNNHTVLLEQNPKYQNVLMKYLHWVARQLLLEKASHWIYLQGRTKRLELAVVVLWSTYQDLVQVQKYNLT